MAIIPPRVTASVRSARLTYLKDVKQKRFTYKDVSPDLPFPSLDPLRIPQIIAEQEDYWFDQNWTDRNAQRRSLTQSAYIAQPWGFPPTLEAYGNVKEPYPSVDGLSHVPKFTDDRSFGAQRLSGANPLVIRRVLDLADYADRLAITDADILPDIKLAQAVSEKRLYICDYKDLTEFSGPGGISNDQLIGIPQTKYLTAPIALFYWRGKFDDAGDLIPIGIQLEQLKSAEVFTPPGSIKPTHPNCWLLAKAAVQVADAHAHEWDAHVVRSHFMLGPFAVSSERHLHDEHPLLLLLRPHLRYLLGINSLTSELVAPGEYGDQLLAPTYEDQIKLLRHNHLKYDFAAQASPHKEITARAMNKSSAPLPYPYRDDALPLYDAIHDFVLAYLKIYYDDSQGEVAKDKELQNFIKELRHDDGGRISKLTPNGAAVEKIAALADLLSAVIWTSGPLHAAVNFAQFGYMADPRNMPFAGYLPPPAAADVPPAENPVAFFPRYSQAKVQAAVMYVLGTWRMDMLGFYRPKDFSDPKALKAIADFQCALARVGADTFQRDATRKYSYPYLVPWNVPNSTNI